MYQRFFGLRELPFELTPNPHYLFLTARHRGVLCNIQYGVTAHRGITLLTGEAGTGKTTLVHTALGLLRQDDVLCVYLNNPTLTRSEFVEFLAHGFALGHEAHQSKAMLLRELERVLLGRRAQGLVSALLVDEAQSLPHDLLEEIRLLANMETPTEKLLPVVLAGQPELANRLNEPRLRQLKQRVALRCDLGPLQLLETASYIAARLERAGGRSAEIFTREAVEMIHARSRGIPRSISVICDNALINGFALNRRPVDREVVAEVCRDLDLGATGGTVAAPPPPVDAFPEQTGDSAPLETAEAEPARMPARFVPREVRELLSSVGRRGRFFGTKS
jgi:general secretion pathway protein A